MALKESRASKRMVTPSTAGLPPRVRNAVALRGEGVARRIRWRVRSDNLQGVGAVGHCGRVPRKMFLLDPVLQELPFVLAFATVVDRVKQFVVIVVMRAPHHLEPASLLKSLGRHFALLWRSFELD